MQGVRGLQFDLQFGIVPPSCATISLTAPTSASACRRARARCARARKCLAAGMNIKFLLHRAPPGI
eukprot:9500642-Pyramimonas_sp.AAC.1